MANYWKLYKKAKAFYFGLGKIKCPALDNQEIIFDWRGFRHFLHKKGGRRSIADQIRRFKLIVDIRSYVEHAVVRRCEPSRNGVKLWSLVYIAQSESVVLVVIEASNKYHFISIMDKQ